MGLSDEDSISLVRAALSAISYDYVLAGPSLSADTVLFDLGLDSIQLMECIGIAEDICGFTLPDSALDTSPPRTIGDLAAVLRRHTTGDIKAPPGGWAADDRLKPAAGPTLEDRQAFERSVQAARDVLSGKLRTRLLDSSAMVLGFMLRGDEGCDCVITDDRFEIQFGWLDQRCRYQLGHVPSILSFLLDRAALQRSATNVHFRLAPGRVEGGDQGRQEPWSFGTREVWIRDEGALIRIAIRPGPAHTTGTLWPAPFKP